MRHILISVMIGSIGYLLVRNAILLAATNHTGSWSFSHILSRSTIHFSSSEERRHRIAAGASSLTNQREENKITVTKLSRGETFLNLFRVNATYFSSPNRSDSQVYPSPTPSLRSTVSAQTNDPSSPAPEKQAANDDDLQCQLCQESLSDCIIDPCNHGGFCKACALSMLKKSNQCPFCRKEIKKVCVVEKINDTQYKILEEIRV